MRSAFNQLLPAFHLRDAIGDEARFLSQLAKSLGYRSHIFCLEADAGAMSDVTPLADFAACDGPDAINLLHYALPSPLSDMLRGSRGHKILLYHNITPPHWFASESRELVHIARAGRAQLVSLAGAVDLALADSEYNRMELEQMGFAPSGVLPIAVDWRRYEASSNPVLLKMFADDFTNILFVGRVTPNKRHEHVIRVYGCYKRFVRERSRLFLVGKWSGFPKYYTRLRQMVDRAKLGDVYFTGAVTQQELVTFYRLADVFLSMSEHEGFCVPLLEAMHFGVPVLARAAAAVPGTLAGSGVLISPVATPLEIAWVAHELVMNQPLRSKIIDGQREALAGYSSASIASRFQDALTGLG